MSCEKYQERLLSFIESGKIDSMPGELEEHLRGCSGCRSEYNELKELFGFLDRDRERDTYDSRLDTLVVDINERLDKQSKLVRLNPGAVYSFIGAVAAALFIMLFGMTQQKYFSEDIYYTDYYNGSSIVEYADEAGLGDELLDEMYSSIDEQSIEQIEEYWIENTDYSNVIENLDEDYIRAIKTAIEQEYKNVS